MKVKLLICMSVGFILQILLVNYYRLNSTVHSRSGQPTDYVVTNLRMDSIPNENRVMYAIIQQRNQLSHLLNLNKQHIGQMECRVRHFQHNHNYYSLQNKLIKCNFLGKYNSCSCLQLMH